jgi:hypothetical protein
MPGIMLDELEIQPDEEALAAAVRAGLAPVLDGQTAPPPAGDAALQRLAAASAPAAAPAAITPQTFLDIATEAPAADESAVTSPLTGRSWSEEERAREEARVQAELGKLPALLKGRPAAPEFESGAREKKFLAENESARKPWRAWAAALTEEGSRAYNDNRRRSDDQLAALREADRAEHTANKPLNDLATMQQAIKFGGLSAEAAAQLTAGSPYVKTLGQGGLMAGLKARGIDTGMLIKEASNTSGERTKALGETGSARNTDVNAAAGVEKARLKAASGGGGPSAADQKFGMAGVLSQQTGIPRDMTLRYVDGDRSGLTKDQLDNLDNYAGTWRMLGAKKRQDALAANMSREAMNTDTVWRATESKRNDPKALLALKEEIDKKVGDLKAARHAWKNMSEGGKNALAKFGGQGGTIATIMRDLQMSEQDKVYFSEIQELANALIKAQSGAAVSEGEWGRLASRMGFAEKDFNLTKNPEVIGNWLERMSQAAVALKRNAVAVYGKPLGDLWPQKAGP